MNQTVKPPDLQPVDDDGPLYAAHKKVYPQSVSGTFRRIKWGLMAACLGVYYFLPFIRWNRGLGAPDQAVLLDFPSRLFYFFGGGGGAGGGGGGGGRGGGAAGARGRGGAGGGRGGGGGL